MMLARLLVVCCLALALYLAFPPRAYAYLDPGTGSYIFQFIIAGIVGIGFLVKVYWGKIKALFRGRSGEEVSEPGEEKPDA
jgi:hypothetical protein